MGAAEGRPLQPWRWLALTGLLLLAVQAVRTAVVAAEGDRDPELAHRVWPSHPKPLLTAALQEIGTAAGQGRTPSRQAFDDVTRAAHAAPLAAEPFLVSATAKIAAGDLVAGEALLNATLHRDPRSPAVSFLLADLALRRGRLSDAVEALAALQRRTGFVSAAFAPALVTFLRQPGGAREIGPILQRNPELRAATLQQLAGAKGSFALLASLIGQEDRSAPWLAAAVDRLVQEGRAAELEAVARHVSANGNRLGSLTPRFGQDAFGWRLLPVSGGGVERAGDGALRLTSFGRDELILAQHPLLLRPGNYVLAQQLSGPGSTDRFEWRLRCPGTEPPTFSIPIEAGKSSTTISIKPSCPTQTLQLASRAADEPRVVSATLSQVSLEPRQ